MGRIIEYTVRLIRVGRRAYDRKWSFCVFFFAVFLINVGILARLDLLPQTSPTPAEAATNVRTEQSVVSVVELPTKIEISKISLSANVINPTTADTGALNKELLNGAVRYPTSAKLGETGNVVFFGHSSYLPVVKNQAYKTFNGIQKLVKGDIITVFSGTSSYTYTVRSVTKENANDNAAIPLLVDRSTLTLVTCNSFGAKEDRFVVVADFVESHSISS